MMAVVATGLVFQDARSGAAVSKPTFQGSIASLSTAPIGSVTPAIALGKDLTKKTTIAKQSASPLPSKMKTVRLAATADPFDNTLTPLATTSPRKVNPFAGPASFRARRSASRGDWPLRQDVAKPDGKRTIFEEL
jgi:hypothetical protein